MKLFSTLFRRKRGILLFVAAFLFPLVFVVVAGIDTFSKRQATTRNLLESNLWLSGRSSLDKIEFRFEELEAEWLNQERFELILSLENGSPEHPVSTKFIFEKDFDLVYPPPYPVNNYLPQMSKNWSAEYKRYMSLAEKAEYLDHDFHSAIANYQYSLAHAATKEQKAIVLEGLARSHKANDNISGARYYYQQLQLKYAKVRNGSGHSYGITAPLQLYALNDLQKKDIYKRDSLLLNYQKLNEGYWLVDPSSYLFFKSEYETALKLIADSVATPYEQQLEFKQLLDDYIFPAIKERYAFAEINGSSQAKRICVHSPGATYLVSLQTMTDAVGRSNYTAGICLNIDSILHTYIRPLISELEQETGLEFRLLNSENNEMLSGRSKTEEQGSLTLPFDKVPFPSTLMAIQPGYEKLQKDVKTQAIIYGLMIVLIVFLMFFAVFVLLRDIDRETNSMLLQTEFVHNVSHELKTPLSLIRLYGETLLLKDNLPSEDKKEGLQIITKESERLSHMINNILDFSKIEMGRKEFDLKPGNLNEVVQNTLDSYRYHLLKKGFKIEEEIQTDIDKVLFDINAVEGVLVNLFSNAIKFSNLKKELKVILKQNANSVYLEISDKGIGIPRNELPNIFNRFYRVKGTAEFESRGSGLGLTLVKHVVDSHAWSISVISIPGEGSTFSIEIPVQTESFKQNE